MAYTMRKPILMDLYPNGSHKQTRKHAHWIEDGSWFEDEESRSAEVQGEQLAFGAWAPSEEFAFWNGDDYEVHDVETAMVADTEADEAEAWVEAAEAELQGAEDNLALVAETISRDTKFPGEEGGKFDTPSEAQRNEMAHRHGQRNVCSPCATRKYT